MVLLTAGMGCGGATPVTETAWHQKAPDQKLEHMKAVIFPAAKADFQQYDATKYADFKCTTCHGAAAKERGFKMPNPDLPPLPTTPEGWGKLKADKPKALEFMHAWSVKMAGFQGEAPFDPATGKGFGCMECHTMAK